MSFVQRILIFPSSILPESFKRLSNIKKFGVISGIAGTILGATRLGQHINGRFARVEEGEEERRRQVQRLQGAVREQHERLAQLEQRQPQPAQTKSLGAMQARLETEEVYQQKLGNVGKAFSSKNLHAFFSDSENRQAFTDSLGKSFRVIVEKGAGTGGVVFGSNTKPEKKCEDFRNLLEQWKKKMDAAAFHTGEEDWQLMSTFLVGVLDQGLPFLFGRTDVISSVDDDQLADAWGKLVEPFPLVPLDQVNKTEQFFGRRLAEVAPLKLVKDAMVSWMEDRAMLLKSKIRERLTGCDPAIGEWLDSAVDLRSHFLRTLLVLLYENDDTAGGKEFWIGIREIPIKYAGNLEAGVDALCRRMMEFYRANVNSSLHHSRMALQNWYLKLFNSDRAELLTPAGALNSLADLLQQHL